jgi:hypothetical protein
MEPSRAGRVLYPILCSINTNKSRRFFYQSDSLVHAGCLLTTACTSVDEAVERVYPNLHLSGSHSGRCAVPRCPWRARACRSGSPQKSVLSTSCLTSDNSLPGTAYTSQKLKSILRLALLIELVRGMKIIK